MFLTPNFDCLCNLFAESEEECWVQVRLVLHHLLDRSGSRPSLSHPLQVHYIHSKYIINFSKYFFSLQFFNFFTVFLISFHCIVLLCCSFTIFFHVHQQLYFYPQNFCIHHSYSLIHESAEYVLLSRVEEGLKRGTVEVKILLLWSKVHLTTLDPGIRLQYLLLFTINAIYCISHLV